MYCAAFSADNSRWQRGHRGEAPARNRPPHEHEL